MQFDFASLKNPESIGYCFHSDTSWHTNYTGTRYSLWAHAGFFQNYDDGLTRHSNESLVPKERMGDYFASLAAFMLEGDNLSRYGKNMQWAWPSVIDAKKIDFLRTLKYDPNAAKTTYYTIEDGYRTSKAPGKRYDKRYHAVKDGMDGSVQSVYTLVRDEYWDFLTCYMAYRQIHKQGRDDDWSWSQDAYEFFSGPDHSDLKLTSEVEHSVAAVDALLKAYRLREIVAPGELRNWLRRSETEETYKQLYQKTAADLEAA